MRSSSATEDRHILGTVVAGFRLERELGRGTRAVVFEATQLTLDRAVALKLLPDDDGGPLVWPEHPRVVSMYAAGSWEVGRFVAMQLVRGPSLAGLLDDGKLEPAAALDLLADVALALDAAHRTGIVHGAVKPSNVFVGADGRALLSDFGLANGRRSVAADRADFAALLRRCLGDRPVPLRDPRLFSAGDLVDRARTALPAPVRRRRRPVLLAAAVCAVAAAAAVLALLDREEAAAVPGVERGARALGSSLASGDVSSVDCAGRAPSGGSHACTVIQARLSGRALTPTQPGVVRRWVVRGARGELALQVIRRRGDRYVSIARSRYLHVPDTGVHVLPARLPVRPGDSVGVQLAPGAAIGVRRGVPGATTARWVGPLFLESRPIELGKGTGFDHEVLLRVDYRPGAARKSPGTLTGARARRAPDGRQLASRTFEEPGRVRRVAVIELAGGIAVDLFAGGRRLARAPVRADPAGRLLSLALSFTTDHAFPTLRWRNPDGRTLRYDFSVGERTLTPRG
jgi:Protein kinase domain